MEINLLEWDNHVHSIFGLYTGTPEVCNEQKWTDKREDLELEESEQVSTVAYLDLGKQEIRYYLSAHGKYLQHPAFDNSKPDRFHQFYDLLHPLDRRFVIVFMKCAIIQLMSLSYTEMKKFWVKIQLRLRCRTGVYCYYNLRVSVSLFDELHCPWIIKVEVRRFPTAYRPEHDHYVEYSHNSLIAIAWDEKLKFERPTIPTERELKGMFHAAEGMQVHEIADFLNISNHTAQNDRKKLFAKLGANEFGPAYRVAYVRWLL